MSDKVGLSDAIRKSNQCPTKFPKTTPSSPPPGVGKIANEDGTEPVVKPRTAMFRREQAARTPLPFAPDPRLARLTETAKDYARAARSRKHRARL